MKFHSAFSRRRVLQMTALGALSLSLLSSCDDKTAEEAPAEQAAETPAAEAAETPAPEQAAPAVSPREALFNQAVYELARKVTNPALFPELTEEVKVMLEHMQAYYAELAAAPEATVERARLALQIADTLRDLNSYAKAAEAYDRALADVNALPEDVRNGDDGQRFCSNIENGIGSCLLMQRKAADALPHYEKALDIARKLYEPVAPAEGAEPQQYLTPAFEQKATDLMDAIRCLGECQRYAEDPEEARTTYKSGQELAVQIKVLPATTSISYIKLLTAMGDLENAEGNQKEALNMWVTAANLSKQLNNSSNRPEVKVATKRCFDGLIPAIQSVVNSINAANADKSEEAKPADADTAQTEPITPELKAAAEAAAQEAPAAPAPAAAPAPTPAKKPAPAKPARKRK